MIFAMMPCVLRSYPNVPCDRVIDLTESDTNVVVVDLTESESTHTEISVTNKSTVRGAAPNVPASTSTAAANPQLPTYRSTTYPPPASRSVPTDASPTLCDDGTNALSSARVPHDDRPIFGRDEDVFMVLPRSGIVPGSHLSTTSQLGGRRK